MGTKIRDTDKGMRKITKELKAADGMRVKVGIQGKNATEAKRYFDEKGQPQTSGAVSLAEVATAHEFGSRPQAIPERSFLRSAIDANRKTLVALNERLLALVARGKLTPEAALGLVGQRIEAAIDDQFESGGQPEWDPLARPRPNRIATNDVPLSDTGQLKNAITSIVVKGKK